MNKFIFNKNMISKFFKAKNKNLSNYCNNLEKKSKSNIKNNSNEQHYFFYLINYYIFLILIEQIFSYPYSIELKTKNTNSSYIRILNINFVDGLSLFMLAPTNYDYKNESNYLVLKCISDECNINLQWNSGEKFDIIGTEKMFKDCDKIISIDFTNFAPEKLVTMSKMFEGCKSLTSIKNLKSINTNDFSYLFSNCENLIDLQNFTIKRADTGPPVYFTMSNMFANCKQLETINISIIGKNYATNMNSMFLNCEKLQYINISSKLNIEYVTDMNSMF